jgi:hypothetical protein
MSELYTVGDAAHRRLAPIGFTYLARNIVLLKVVIGSVGFKNPTQEKYICHTCPQTAPIWPGEI